MSGVVGRVAQLWRYPVKSMAGVAHEVLDLDANGVVADRDWAVLDSTTGVVVSHESAPLLLHVGIRIDEVDHRPSLLVPGVLDWVPADAAGRVLSSYLGRDVELVSRRSAGDALAFDYGLPLRNTRDQGFCDVAGVVHLVSAASLAWLAADDHDGRRVRANMVLELDLPAFGEHQLVGSQVQVGSARLLVTETTERCAVLDASRPGWPATPGSLARVQDAMRGHLGVYAQVLEPSPVHAGDDVRVVTAP